MFNGFFFSVTHTTHLFLSSWSTPNLTSYFFFLPHILKQIIETIPSEKKEKKNTKKPKNFYIQFFINRIASQSSRAFRLSRWHEVHQKFTRIFFTLLLFFRFAALHQKNVNTLKSLKVGNTKDLEKKEIGMQAGRLVFNDKRKIEFKKKRFFLFSSSGISFISEKERFFWRHGRNSRKKTKTFQKNP